MSTSDCALQQSWRVRMPLFGMPISANEFESVPLLPKLADCDTTPMEVKKSSKNLLPIFDWGTTFGGNWLTLYANAGSAIHISKLRVAVTSISMSKAIRFRCAWLKFVV